MTRQHSSSRSLPELGVGVTMSGAHQLMLIYGLFLVSISVWAAVAQPDAQPGPPMPSRSAARLFTPDTSVAAASVSPLNLQISEPVIEVAAVAGGEPQPNVQVVKINRALLTSAPRRLVLNLPGNITVTAIRRSDLTRLASSVQVTPVTQLQGTEPYGAAAMWVGEVSRARGGLSSIVLIAAENGGIYGNIRYLDRKADRIRTFKVFPMILEGVDPVAAAAMPDFAPASAGISLASLYPRIHRSRHMIVEYQEPDPPEPTPEEEAMMVDNSPPGTANAKPATVDTTPVGATAVAEPLVITTDVQTLAASMAASAGPDVVAALGPGGFTAAAASAITRAQAGAAAPPAPLAPVEDPAATAADAVIGGRRMQQAIPNPAANIRQDVLVMYTTFAAQRGGGAAALESTIRARIVDTNKAYSDSGVNIDLVLVGIRPTSYSESGKSLNTILDNMRAGSGNGLTAARDQLGADFVQLWTGTTSTSGTCGLGWVFLSSVPSLTSVVNSICFTGYTVAHELGHNQGCFHSAGDTGSVVDYAAGWRRCDLGSRAANFNTIMAYKCSGGSTDIAYLSNPARSYNGRPAGDATSGNCARRLAETAVPVANVRNEVVPSTAGALRTQVAANKCVDAWKYLVGTQVAINDCATLRSYQRWERLPDGSLRAPSTERCMQVSTTVLAGGAFPVEVRECSAIPAVALSHQWFNDRLGRLHPYSTPTRCLTLPNSNTANGQGLTVTDCVAPTGAAPNGAINQRWTNSTALFTAAFNPQNNRFQSRLSATAQCVDNLSFNTTNGAPIAMMPCNPDAATNQNQRWSLTDSGQLQLMFNTAKCLTAAGVGTNGDLIRLSDCTSVPNQRWFLDTLSRLRPYHAPSKCMDIRAASTAAGAILQITDCLDLNQQKWTVIP